MKYFSFLALVFCLSLFHSCSPPPDQDLIGKWDYSEVGIHVLNSIFIADTTVVQEKGMLTFKINGVGTFASTDTTYPIKWLLAENEITITKFDTIATTYMIDYDENERRLWSHEKILTTTENDVVSTEKWNSIAILQKL